jgi:hypothetical protein
VQVHLILRVLPEEGVRELPVTLLSPAPTRLEELTVNGTPLEMVEERPFFRTASLPLPQGDTFEGVTVELAYTVHGAWEEGGRVTVPVPAPLWLPQDPQPATFVANLRIPPGVGVLESFPTSVALRPDGTNGGDYRVTLQSVPSMLILRMVDGEMPLLTVERVLDAGVVLLLVVMGLLGVGYLRREGR